MCWSHGDCETCPFEPVQHAGMLNPCVDSRWQRYVFMFLCHKCFFSTYGENCGEGSTWGLFSLNKIWQHSPTSQKNWFQLNHLKVLLHAISRNPTCVKLKRSVDSLLIEDNALCLISQDWHRDKHPVLFIEICFHQIGSTSTNST